MHSRLGAAALVLFAIFAINAFACTNSNGGVDSPKSNRNTSVSIVSSIVNPPLKAPATGEQATATR